MRFLAIILLVNMLYGEDMKSFKLPFEIIKEVDEVKIFKGGYGSGAFSDFKGGFYALSDNGIKQPAIGHFVFKKKKLILKRHIPLSRDLNPEGLVALKEGGFWICDEDSMSFIKINKDGKELRRISKMPKIFKHIAKNRGFEGLAISKDERFLTAIVQSSLKNKTTKFSVLTRILKLDLKTGKTAQYIYPQEKSKHSNSEIVYLNDDEYLVLERDSKKPLKDKKAFKRVFKISLKNATDITHISKNLEKFVLKKGLRGLKKLGIRVAKKELLVDLVRETSYIHDKPEGMFITLDGELAILNDDDFGIRRKNGKIKQKYIKNNLIDFSELVLLKVKM